MDSIIKKFAIVTVIIIALSAISEKGFAQGSCIAGDASGDGYVNIVDIIELANYFCQLSDTINDLCGADNDGDCDISNNVLSCSGVLTSGSDPDPIPAMSQWALILFSLLVLSVGIYYLGSKRGNLEQ